MRCLRQCPGGTTEIVEVSSRIVSAGCPNANQICSSPVAGFLPAIVACLQGLHTEACTTVAVDPTESTATATATMMPIGSASAHPVLGNIFERGAGFNTGAILTLIGGTFTTVAKLTVTSLSSVLGQTDTAFVGGELSGTFTGGTGYSASDTITMNDGTIILVTVDEE